MAEQRGQVVPVHARHDQAVEIHWRLPDGKELIERHTSPPKAVVAVRMRPSRTTSGTNAAAMERLGDLR